MTNFEKIKQMDVMELAEFICGIYDDYDEIPITKFINGTSIPNYGQFEIAEWLESEEDNEKV